MSKNHFVKLFTMLTIGVLAVNVVEAQQGLVPLPSRYAPTIATTAERVAPPKLTARASAPNGRMSATSAAVPVVSTALPAWLVSARMLPPVQSTTGTTALYLPYQPVTPSVRHDIPLPSRPVYHFHFFHHRHKKK